MDLALILRLFILQSLLLLELWLGQIPEPLQISELPFLRLVTNALRGHYLIVYGLFRLFDGRMALLEPFPGLTS